MRNDIKSFLNYLTVEKGFSNNTTDAYGNDLSQMVTFAEKEAGQRSVMPSWASFNTTAAVATTRSRPSASSGSRS